MRLSAIPQSVNVDSLEHQPRRNLHTLRPTSRGKIISQDPRLAQVLDTIDRVARSTCTVLVTGESGTGKELVVAALHDASTRRNAPLITINCGAIPNELVESELFGHAKGAFTGAQGSRRGLVAAAEGGTLFLDEVGELPLAVQVKLLRLLQQREYTPLGETRATKCDVRIVAATNRDLEAEVKAGRFREDLYYRLNVIHVELPALRERVGDLGLLARHFCRVFAERSGRDDLRGLSDEAVAAIEAYPWPGNVRALENAIERGTLLARGPYVEAEDVFGRVARSLQKRTPPPMEAEASTAEVANAAATPSPIDVHRELRALRPVPPGREPTAARGGGDRSGRCCADLQRPGARVSVSRGSDRLRQHRGRRRASRLRSALPARASGVGHGSVQRDRQLPEQPHPPGAHAHGGQPQSRRAAPRPEPHHARGDDSSPRPVSA